MSHFHKNLNFLMRNGRETQASVAEFVGVSQPAVCNWLRDTMPQTETLEKIAQFFAVPVDELVNHKLPHKRNIEALAELERELKELKTSWNKTAKGMKEKAAKLAGQQNYFDAAQIDSVAISMEDCSKDLSKVLEMYFPDGKQTASADQQSGNNSSQNSSAT